MGHVHPHVGKLGEAAAFYYHTLGFDHALFDDSHQLSTLIGRPTTPLAAAVAEALKRIV